MSILNVWLDVDTALVGVDTDGIAPGGEHLSTAKMIPMVNANCILACRGNALLLALVFITLNSRADTFDGLAAILPDVVRKSFNDSGLSKIKNDLGHEILLIGHSASAGRMKCCEVVSNRDVNDFSVSFTDEHYITPWDESIKDAPNPSSFAAMLELSRRQVQLIKTLGDSAAGGGYAVMAYINEHGMALRRNQIPEA